MSDHPRCQLGKIEDKIDKIQKKMASIDSTLAAQHESLKIHIKRTNLLEQKIEPIDKHVTMVNGVLKFLGVVSLIAGLILSILQIKNG